MGRNRDTGLFVGLILSLTLHAALAYATIVASVGGRVGTDPYATGPRLELLEPPPPPPPPESPPPEPTPPDIEEERTIRLGIDESDAVTATWLGGPEDRSPIGELSTIEQAAAALPFGERPGPFSIAQAPAPSMPAPAETNDPAPDSEQTPSAAPTAAPPLSQPPEVVDAPPREEPLDVRTDDAQTEGEREEQSRDEMLDEARRLLAQAASLLEVLASSPPPAPPRSNTPEVSAAPLSPEAIDNPRDAPDDAAPTLDEPDAPAQPRTTPSATASEGAAPSDSAGATNEPAPGEIADSESDGARIRDEVNVEPGKPLAAKGLQIRTVRPRWSHYTLITANPRNALVRVRFNREGHVIDAEIVESSGRTDVDRPLLAAMYDWRAEGAPLRELPPDVEGEPPHTVELHFRILMRK